MSNRVSPIVLQEARSVQKVTLQIRWLWGTSDATNSGGHFVRQFALNAAFFHHQGAGYPQLTLWVLEDTDATKFEWEVIVVETNVELPRVPHQGAMVWTYVTTVIREDKPAMHIFLRGPV